MKILVSNVDHLVIYADDSMVLTDSELTGDGWRDPKFNATNSRIEDAELPSPWAGGAYQYNGAWSVANQSILDALAAARMPTLSDYDAALTAHLDSVAQSRRWQDRISLMSRAGFPGPWQADAIAFGQWADGCNVIGYQMLADFQAGNIPQPSVEDVIAALPPMVWPT